MPQGIDYLFNFRATSVLGVHIHCDGPKWYADFELKSPASGDIWVVGTPVGEPWPSREAAEAFAAKALLLMIERDKDLAKLPQPDGTDKPFQLDGDWFVMPGPLLQEVHRLGPWSEAVAITRINVCRTMLGGRITVNGVHSLSEDDCTVLYMAIASLWLMGFPQYPVDTRTLN